MGFFLFEAKIQEGKTASHEEKIQRLIVLLPFHFAHGGSLEDWLRSRAMDCHSRTNARMLRISDEAPQLIPL
ncbi:hypothetical protein [Allofournierella sp.]|uniref:hypothetical protein n=1 Tax=Allofournierella sp. TaxID=1940256 RepID=UPI003AB8944D